MDLNPFLFIALTLTVPVVLGGIVGWFAWLLDVEENMVAAILSGLLLLTGLWLAYALTRPCPSIEACCSCL